MYYLASHTIERLFFPSFFNATIKISVFSLKFVTIWYSFFFSCIKTRIWARTKPWISSCFWIKIYSISSDLQAFFVDFSWQLLRDHVWRQPLGITFRKKIGYFEFQIIFCQVTICMSDILKGTQTLVKNILESTNQSEPKKGGKR